MKKKSKQNKQELILRELRKLNRNIDFIFSNNLQQNSNKSYLRFDAVELESHNPNISLKNLEKSLNRIIKKHRELLVIRKEEKLKFGGNSYLG